MRSLIAIVAIVALLINSFAFADEAIGLLLEKAKTGDAEARLELGKRHNELSEYYLEKGKAGDAEGQYQVGISFRIKLNYDEAELWYIKSGEQGHMGAQFMLGNMYYNGKSFTVAKDFKSAYYWYSKAAEQGDGMSQGMLAYMHENGEGVMKDYVEAYKWYNLASAHEYDNAKEQRDELEKRMTKETVAEGQRLAREWMKSRP